jgi:hypothetical protein
MRAFDGEVVIAVAQLYLVRVSAVHSGRVFRTALPDNNHENSRAAINACAIYAG